VHIVESPIVLTTGTQTRTLSVTYSVLLEAKTFALGFIAPVDCVADSDLY